MPRATPPSMSSVPASSSASIASAIVNAIPTTVVTIPMIWGTHTRSCELIAGDGSGIIPDAAFDCFNGDPFHLRLHITNREIYSMTAHMEETDAPIHPKPYHSSLNAAAQDVIYLPLNAGLIYIRFKLSAEGLDWVAEYLLAYSRLIQQQNASSQP